MMEVTKTDLLRCENLVRALKKGEFKLDGEEVMAMSQSIVWASQLAEKIKAALEAPKPEANPKAEDFGGVKGKKAK